jgi:putative membrane protein
VGAVIAAIAAVQFLGAAGGLSGRAVLIAVAIAVVVLGLIAGVSYLQWTRFEFWFDDDGDLRVASGVLQRRERRLQLSRLQSVDVAQPLLARVFGMAVVKVEVAGGGDSRITLSYLTLADAQAFRAETLARAAGVRPDAGEAPETVLVQVPNPVLIKAGLLNTGAWISMLVVVVAIVFAFITGGWMSLGLLVLLVIPGATGFSFFASYFNFTVADSPDGLRTRFGLLGVQAHTVPPGRVASIEFVEPLLWRKMHWVMVRITVAGTQGSSSDEDNSGSSAMLLPVATWDVATEVVARVLPGVDVRTFPLEPVPAQARRRAPLQWRNLGLGADERVVVTRRGWLTRRTSVTPHARVQSVRMVQGPWQRALGLASVHFDVVPGPVNPVALYRGISEAGEVMVAEVDRMRAAVLVDRSVRWGRHAEEPRVTIPAPASEPEQPELPFADAHEFAPEDPDATTVIRPTPGLSQAGATELSQTAGNGLGDDSGGVGDVTPPAR